MSAPAPSARAPTGFATEATPIGVQSLVPGVAPITQTDRLAWRAAQPLGPPKPQRPCDVGLFDLAARNQLELFAAPPAPPQPSGPPAPHGLAEESDR